jgi:hypothetical protein
MCGANFFAKIQRASQGNFHLLIDLLRDLFAITCGHNSVH